MKNKTKLFHIEFGNLDDVVGNAKQVLAGKSSSKVTSAAVFRDLNAFMTFMFPNKFFLLVMIKAKNPSSMYELAKLVGKSQSGVLRDCKELEEMGFISLFQEGVRNAQVPKLKFDYNQIVVHADIGECRHVLPAA